MRLGIDLKILYSLYNIFYFFRISNEPLLLLRSQFRDQVIHYMRSGHLGYKIQVINLKMFS